MQGPDRRHLENTHKRVNGDDGLNGSIVEPYLAPLLYLAPDPSPRTKPMSLKVVIPEATESPSGAGKADCNGLDHASQRPIRWQYVMSNKKSPTPTVVPAWAESQARRSSLHPSKLWKSSVSEFPQISASSRTDIVSPVVKSLPVQAPTSKSVSASKGPERLVRSPVEPAEQPSDEHSAVNQKKRAAKQAREVKRKAKKLTTDIEVVDPLPAQEDISPVTDDGMSMEVSSPSPTDSYDDSHLVATEQFLSLCADLDVGLCLDKPESPEDSVTDTCDEALVSPLPITKHGKHMHWVKFTRMFTVDQLTMPNMSIYTACTHDTSCVFEGNNVPDCPFHKPREFPTTTESTTVTENAI